MLYLSIWVIALILFGKSLASSDGTAFLGPSGITGNHVELEQTWFIGDEKHFTWNSTWVAVDLNYQGTDSLIAITIGSYITDYNLDWFVNVSDSQSHSEYFFFYLVESANPENYIVSNLIRILEDPGSPTFTSIPTSMRSASLPAKATSTVVETEIITLTTLYSVALTAASQAAVSSTSASIAATSIIGSSTTAGTNVTSTVSDTSISQMSAVATGSMIAQASSNTEEKIVFGVAIPLAVIALTGVAAFIWWRCPRRRQSSGAINRKPSSVHNMYRHELDIDVGISEIADDEYYDNGVKRAKRGFSELSGLTGPSEMDTNMAHELPDSPRGEPEMRSLMSGREVSEPGSPRLDREVGAETRE